jgi:ABC-type glycerol-3-phosphate transport system substrate-binding protein
MLKRKSWLGLALGLLALSSLSVMTAFAQDPTATPVPVPSPTAAVADIGTGDLKISFWNGLTGSDGTTLNAMLGAYAAENPEVAITTEIIPWGTLYTKLQAAFVAGQPPDLFMLHASEIPQFYSYGALMDLSSMYDTAGGTLPAADFAQPGFGGVFVDGIPYGVPLDNHGRGTWINTDLFEAAGVDTEVQPENYEELVETLKLLTLDANGNNAASADFDAENVVQWGTAIEWAYVEFESYLWGNGGSIISEDGKTATINSEAGVDALQKMYDLIYVHHVAPPPAGFDSWQGFSTGAVAALPTGTWFRNFAEEQTDINSKVWSVFPVGAERATWFGAHVFLIPATATGEKLEAAKKLIQWVSDHQTDWAASGQVPARISAQQALDAETYPSNIYLGADFQAFGRMEVVSPVILELQAAIDPELSSALNGQKTPKQALDDAAARMQQVLDRNS